MVCEYRQFPNKMKENQMKDKRNPKITNVVIKSKISLIELGVEIEFKVTFSEYLPAICKKWITSTRQLVGNLYT